MPTAIVQRMVGRDPTEAHRASTPLELLFDLTFVVAIAQCAASLHYGIADDHIAASLEAYPKVFFAIWWAWMNFTWFASAYDTDDAFYRLAVFVQMSGVLILAAGVPRAFDSGDFAMVTIGYLVMRAGLVSLWVRAAGADPANRRTALRSAASLAVLQAGWLLLLTASVDVGRVGFVVLVALELMAPVWAQQAGATGWHPHHIAERYGLFTIIVLGESVLSATIGVQTALDAGEALGDIVPVIVGGLLIVFALWWLYFDQPAAAVAGRARSDRAHATQWAFLWGYGHYAVFASAAATGAGLAVAVDHATEHSEISGVVAGLALTVPIVVFTLTLWALHGSERPEGFRQVHPFVVAVLVLGASWTPQPALIAGVVLAGTVVVIVGVGHRAGADAG